MPSKDMKQFLHEFFNPPKGWIQANFNYLYKSFLKKSIIIFKKIYYCTLIPKKMKIKKNMDLSVYKGDQGT